MAKEPTANQMAELLQACGLSPDSWNRFEGAYRIRRHYFYRHGKTAEQWHEDVLKALSQAGVRVIDASCKDVWRQWGRGDSYFESTIRIDASTFPFKSPKSDAVGRLS